MYIYATQKKELFTEEGSALYQAIRDNVKNLLATSGAVMMKNAIVGTGDSWTMLACVDRMVELGEIREVTALDSCQGQHRVFVVA